MTDVASDVRTPGIEAINIYLEQDEQTRLANYGGHFDNPEYFQARLVVDDAAVGENADMSGGGASSGYLAIESHIAPEDGDGLAGDVVAEDVVEVAVENVPRNDRGVAVDVGLDGAAEERGAHRQVLVDRG